MPSSSQSASVSKKKLWAGRIISGLVVAFLLFDSVTKLMRIAPVMQALARLGYPPSAAITIGTILLVCVIIYVIPQTSILGAVLLTGYLGGAVDANVRASNPWFETIIPVLFGVLVWAGVFLRDEGIRKFIPWRS